MRVIFLDIDGVLNSEAFSRTLEEQHRQLGHHEVCECFKLMRQVDREAVARLNRLVAATQSKIVISSSWRKLFDPPELHRILAEHGLVAEIIGETPDGQGEPEMLDVYGPLDRIFRGHEIDFWLRKHPEVDRFVILDDCSDMEMHKNRLVQTDCEEGLLDEHVEMAIRMMSWDGKTIPSTMDELDAARDMEADCTIGAGIAEQRRNMKLVDPPPSAQSGSSAGLHCNHDQHLRDGGCPERLTLKRTTVEQPTHEDDYRHFMPALYEAAVLLGWRVYRCVWWCPTHVVAKNLACARCLSACPACSCIGGPRSDAVDGIDIEVTETPLS